MWLIFVRSLKICAAARFLKDARLNNMFKDELNLFFILSSCDYSSFGVKILVSSPGVMVGLLTHV